MTKAYLEEGCAAGHNLNSLKRAAPISARARYHFASLTSAARRPKRPKETMPFERRVFVACAA